MPGLLEGVLAAAKARTAAALVKPVVKPNVSNTEVKPKAVVTPKTPSKAGTPKPIAGTPECSVNDDRTVEIKVGTRHAHFTAEGRNTVSV